MKLYHYTSLMHLPSIQATGRLKTTESSVSMAKANAGPPVVWLLDLPTADGADHGLRGSMVDKKRVRFTVDVPRARVRRWFEWAYEHHMDLAWAQSFVAAGGGKEAASHWYVTERPIDERFWVEVRDMQRDTVIWRQGAWAPSSVS